MADFNSSLPVRTEQAGDVEIKLVDGTITSRKLTVNADGSINITDNGTSITVDAADLDIRDLAFATDKVDVTGSTVALDAPTLAALESVTVQNGTGAAAVNIQDGGNSITVDAVDLDVRDLTHVSDSIKIGDGTDFLAVNADGSINVVVSDMTPGVATVDFNVGAIVAGGATSTHTFTATGNFNLTQVVASASGKMKIEVQVNGVTKLVGFNSTSEPNIDVTFSQQPTVIAGQTVTVIRTNRDNQSQDLYSTILGFTL